MMSMMASSSLFDSHNNEIDQYSGDLPASPTAALWNASEEEKQYRKRTTKKSVKFSTEVKQHDGLTSRNSIFDQLITYYFVEQREVSELDVLSLTCSEYQTIIELHEDLLDMVKRINDSVEEGKQCAPVLPRGGGLCTKLCPPHVPYIRVLDRVVEAAANRVLKATAASSQQQQ